jgi:ABC-type polysaccharide/polyol phosphate export permease
MTLALELSAATWGLWPELLVEGLVVVVAAGYLWYAMAPKPDFPIAPLRLRLLSAVGLVATLALIFIGGIWPSLLTIMAIPAIPAPFLFGVAIFNPGFISGKQYLRAYLNLCVLLSGLAWAAEFFWRFRLYWK